MSILYKVYPAVKARTKFLTYAKHFCIAWKLNINMNIVIFPLLLVFILKEFQMIFSLVVRWLRYKIQSNFCWLWNTLNSIHWDSHVYFIFFPCHLQLLTWYRQNCYLQELILIYTFQFKFICMRHCILFVLIS